MSTYKGKEVGFYTLSSGAIEAVITNFGARIVSLRVGGVDVVLGFDSVDDYFPQNHASDFGAIIGRYANRIAKGRFAIDWDVVQLPRNNGPNCLHGGPDGWQYQPFDVLEVSPSAIRLAIVSPDGDNGFPGTVRAEVLYSLSADGALRIDYSAVTDQPTVINLTNHSYFNLNGTDKTSPLTDIHNHTLRIDADFYTPTDNTAIPLGKHMPVDGTPFDFRSAKPIGRDIAANHPQLHIGRGYDHNFVLRAPSLDNPSVFLSSPATGISIEVFTTAPGIQLYTGNFLDGVRGKGGIAYPVRSAVCLETQQYPDSPNHSWPESTGRLMPDHPFSSTTIFKFSQQ